MNIRSKSGVKYTAIFLIAVFVAFYLAYLCGMRINRTHSLPKGIYWMVNKTPERGDIVAFWPQDNQALRLGRERGYIIPGVYNKADGIGYGLLLKRYLGLPGDIVSITDIGITINGVAIPNTKPLNADNMGDPLPRIHLDNYQLREHEALFVSDHLPRSFDARYFGVQETRQIVDVVVPVWTW